MSIAFLGLEIFCIGIIVFALFLLLKGDGLREQKLMQYFLLGALCLYIFKLTQGYDLTPVVMGVVLSGVVILIWSRNVYDFSSLTSWILLDSISDGVIAIDEQMRIASYNPAAAHIFEDLGSRALINDILDLSKVEAGKMERVLSEYHVKTLVNEMLNMMDVVASQRGLLLKSAFDMSIPCRYLGDEGRIKQILINILNNALKFTKEGYVKNSVSGTRQDEADVERLVFCIGYML